MTDRRTVREGAASTPTARRMGAIVEDAVSHGDELLPGELVTHFDLVAVARRIDSAGNERFRRYRWSLPGSDPHLSAGSLRAELARVEHGLTGCHCAGLADAEGDGQV